MLSRTLIRWREFVTGITRLRNAVWNYASQFHHADLTLRVPGRSGGNGLGAGHRTSGSFRAPRSHPEDGTCRGPWFAPARDWKWRPRTRNRGPMAVVILGGLVTSTLLNLLVLPTLAMRYGRFESRIP